MLTKIFKFSEHGLSLETIGQFRTIDYKNAIRKFCQQLDVVQSPVDVVVDFRNVVSGTEYITIEPIECIIRHPRVNRIMIAKSSIIDLILPGITGKSEKTILLWEGGYRELNQMLYGDVYTSK